MRIEMSGDRLDGSRRRSDGKMRRRGDLRWRGMPRDDGSETREGGFEERRGGSAVSWECEGEEGDSLQVAKNETARLQTTGR